MAFALVPRVAVTSRVVFSLVIVLACWSSAAAVVPTRIVAYTGQQASGAPDGVTFLDFHDHGLNMLPTSPVINAHGSVAFGAHLTGAGVDTSNDTGAWSTVLTLQDLVLGSGPPLHLVGRAGNHAPGTPAGVLFNFVRPPTLSDDARAAFFGSLTGPGIVFDVNDYGIWEQSGGVRNALALRVLVGTQAPGTSQGVTFNNFYRWPLSSRSQMALSTALTGVGVAPGNDSGIWSDASGSLALVARAGDPAPGLPDVHFAHLITGLAVNGAGQLAFWAPLTGPGGDSESLWLQSSGSLALVARTGVQAPGMGNGVYFTHLYPLAIGTGIVINDSGQLVFTAQVAGPRLMAGIDDQGIWSDRNGALGPILRAGSQAPGTDAGVTFGYLPMPAFNSQGRIAFSSYITGPGVTSGVNDTGIWTDASNRPQDAGSPPVLRLVARTGDAAPGTGGQEHFTSFELPNLNAVGQTAFAAVISLGGNNFDRGIYVTDSDNVLTPVAQTGEHFFVPGVGTRDISDLQLIYGSSGGQGVSRGSSATPARSPSTRSSTTAPRASSSPSGPTTTVTASTTISTIARASATPTRPTPTATVSATPATTARRWPIPTSSIPTATASGPRATSPRRPRRRARPARRPPRPRRRSPGSDRVCAP